MIVKDFYIGDTHILVDDTYFPKTEEENQKVYEEFNRIGCLILTEEFLKRQRKERRTGYGGWW